MADLDRRKMLAIAAAAALPAGASAKAVKTPPHEPVPVAVLLDEGATVIDFAGPWEAFQDAEAAEVPGFKLFTVAPTLKPLAASAGLKITPDYSFETAPPARVLVFGAQVGGTNPTKLEWIRKTAASADFVLSVCTGAFLLARTGLIDGLSATTHHDFYEAFEKEFPKVRLLKSRRFVDNGKFISAGGLTSGIDGALHVVANYYGEAAARRTAVYMEHDDAGWLSGVRA